MRIVIDIFLLSALLFLCGVVFYDKAERLEQDRMRQKQELKAKKDDPEEMYRDISKRVFKLNNQVHDVGTAFVVEYKQKRFMVTAEHVCRTNRDGGLYVNGSDKKYAILSVNLLTDVCIMAAPNVAGLKLAFAPAKLYEHVHSIGNPFKQVAVLSGGYVGRQIQLSFMNEVTETSIKTGPGASGSPVFNKSGDVVGMMQSYYVDTNDGLYVDRRKIMDIIDLELYYFSQGRGN
jgi:S1-C subfamily serine protease